MRSDDEITLTPDRRSVVVNTIPLSERSEALLFPRGRKVLAMVMGALARSSEEAAAYDQAYQLRRGRWVQAEEAEIARFRFQREAILWGA